MTWENMTKTQKLIWLKKLSGGGTPPAGDPETVSGSIYQYSGLKFEDAAKAPLQSLKEYGSVWTTHNSETNRDELWCNNGKLAYVDGEVKAVGNPEKTIISPYPTLPEGYEHAEYLELTGLQEGMQPSLSPGLSNLIFEFDVCCTFPTTSAYVMYDLCQSDNSSSFINTGLIYSDNSNFFAWYGPGGHVPKSADRRSIVRVTYTTSPGSNYRSATFQVGDITTDTTSYIGGTSYLNNWLWFNGFGNHPLVGKVWSVKVYLPDDDNRLIYYGIPCKNLQTGEGGLYDIHNAPYIEEPRYGFAGDLGSVQGAIKAVGVKGRKAARAVDLLQWGDIQTLTSRDEQDLVTGEVTRRIGKIFLTGNEEWREATTSGVFYMPLGGQWSGERLAPFCNIYPGTREPNADMSNHTSAVSQTQTAGYALHIKCTEYTNNLAGFKAHLAELYSADDPVIVVYPLVTPVSETVAKQNIRSFKGDNAITIQSDLEYVPFYKEVTYLKTDPITTPIVGTAQVGYAVI